jgi:hypothetical protein
VTASGAGDYGIELLFERTAESLQAAVSSAVIEIEQAGLRASKMALERESIPA